MSEKFDVSVLFVEDDESILQELSYTLKNLVTKLYIARDGQEGLSLYLKEKPDIVLTDINLPKLDGLAMSKEIKTLNAETKIIVMSAFSQSDVLLKAIHLGVDAYLTKPLKLKDLFDSLRKVSQSIILEKEKNQLTNLLHEYKKTVDLSSIVSKTDASGKITFVNKQFEQISGYSKEELIGKPHSLIRHVDMPKSAFEQMWQNIKKEKKPWFGVVKNRRKDGSAYYVKTVINPILDAKGNVLEFIAIRSDITELEETKQHLKKQYHISEEKFEDVSLLSQLYEDAMDRSSIVIRISADMHISYVNDMFCELTGYCQSELIGKPYFVLRHPAVDKEHLKKAFDEAYEKGIWRGQLRGLTKEGKEIHFISTIVSIKDKHGKLLEYMGIRLDITQIITLHEELEETQREIIYTMGEIGETRSKETGFHVKRVAEYSKLLALKAGLSLEEAELLKMASPMHDIGKVGIPDNILNKPGKLTASEYEVMKEHANIGYELLRNSSRELLRASAIVAYEHHERWDGTGYPRGLKAEAIHIFGRITAICDVFDALAHERPYKKAWDLERVLAFLKEESGKHFDPRLITLFLANLDAFLEIKERYTENFSPEAE